MTRRAALAAGWLVAIGAAAGIRAWNALEEPLMWGYDAWGHLAYVLFLDLYRAVPWADQGWSYYHPPFHYVFGWVLAQFGSGDVLIRGLSFVASAASLGTAALAAWLVRATTPERPALALLAFSAVALLPVHFLMSSRPDNGMTETFLAAASLTAFIANERRARPGLALDVVTGLLLGLVLLTKHSGLLPLGVVGIALGLRLLSAPARRVELPRTLARGAVIAGVAVLIAGPIYLRNARAFGTPIPSNSDFPLVGDIEREQPPGFRRWHDYLRVTPKMFTDPNPLAPHMLHAVWSTVYMNLWADTFRESDRSRSLELESTRYPSFSVVALLGLVPTALAFAGGWIAFVDVRQGRRRPVYVPMLALSAVVLAAFVRFTWGVPTWAALKASYCMGLSLPFAVFLARSVEALVERDLRWAYAAGAAVALALAAASLNATSGLILPRRQDAPAAAAVRFYFGEYEDARCIYGRLIQRSANPLMWLDNLAAVELADGRPERARRQYARAISLARSPELADPYRPGRLAVATALEGDLAAARAVLDEQLAETRLPELLANRGAVSAAAGDLGTAERELRAALDEIPAMVPAWLNLAVVLERTGRDEEGAAARRRAAAEACRGPRGYPYGLGTGEVLQWGVGRRWLLLLEGDAEGLSLRAALPAFYRGACRRLRDRARAGERGCGLAVIPPRARVRVEARRA